MTITEAIKVGAVTITMPAESKLRCTIIDFENNLQKALAPGDTCPMNLGLILEPPVIVEGKP